MKKLKVLFVAALLLLFSIEVFAAQVLEKGQCIFAGADFTLVGSDQLALRWQDNGNLVLSQKTTAGPAQLWESNTTGRAGRVCRLVNGNLVLLRGAVNFVADEPVALERGRCIWSQKTLADNGTAVLIWQNDGNLVLYKTKWDKGRRIAVWASNTSTGRGKGPKRRLCFSEEGNLSVQDEAGNSFWETNTAGRGRALQLGYDCNLQVIDANKMPLWAARPRTMASQTAFCGVPFTPLWQGFRGGITDPVAELKLDACTASLVNESGVLWQTDTKWCVPAISDTFSLPDNTAFIPAAYFYRNKKIFSAVGAESRGGGQWPGLHDNWVPYIRLFDDQRFGGAYFELINISLSDLRKIEGHNFQVSSLEFRGRWQLCSEPNYEGRCIEVDARGHAGVEDLEDEYGEHWNNAVSSVRLLGYTHPVTPVLHNAGFADTHKICIETTDDASQRSEAQNLRLYLKRSTGGYFINSGGKPSWCQVSHNGESGRHCCDTGYNGTQAPAFVGWERLNNQEGAGRVLIKKLDITGRAKLQNGHVGEAAIINVMEFNPPQHASSYQLCLNQAQHQCVEKGVSAEPVIDPGRAGK